MQKDITATQSFVHNIFQFLKISDFYGVSEEVDIAKGKYEIPKDFKEMRNYFKRRKKYVKNGN